MPRADPRGLDHLFTFFALGTRRTMFEGVQAIAAGLLSEDKLAGPPAARLRSSSANIGTSISRIGARRTIRADEHGADRRVRGDLHPRNRDQAQGRRAGGRLSLRRRRFSLCARRRRRKCAAARCRASPSACRSRGSTRQPRRASLPRISAARRPWSRPGPDLITGTYPALIQAAESPVLDTSCAALLALSREVHRQGYKAVLTGEGADEGFAGYVWFKIREIARSLDIGDSLPAKHRHQPRGAQMGGAGHELRRAGPHRRHDRRPARAVDHLQSRGDVADALLQRRHEGRAGGHVAYEDLALDLDRMRRWHPLNRSLYLGYKVHLPGLLLSQKGDRVAMANSVETRYPFLDEDVIAFISRIHPRWKLRRGLKDKYLLRQGGGARSCRKRWRGGGSRCSGRRWPRPSCATRRAFVRDLMSPDIARARRLFRRRGGAAGLRSRGQGRGRQARHFREPRSRRRGGDPALASPLSRRRLVRAAEPRLCA